MTMDNSLFADFAGSLERVKINGEERSFADCDGVILRPKDSDEPEFFWLSLLIRIDCVSHTLCQGQLKRSHSEL